MTRGQTKPQSAILAYVGIGSNVGPSVETLLNGLSLLENTEGILEMLPSMVYETEPWGNPNQPWFVNAVAQIKTTLSPSELLDRCLAIERELGRNREDDTEKWGPRSLDLDILLYDNWIVEEPDLTIPHPQCHNRAFVLVPMLEIAPDAVHPVLGQTIHQLHLALHQPEAVYLFGTRETSQNI